MFASLFILYGYITLQKCTLFSPDILPYKEAWEYLVTGKRCRKTLRQPSNWWEQLMHNHLFNHFLSFFNSLPTPLPSSPSCHLPILTLLSIVCLYWSIKYWKLKKLECSLDGAYLFFSDERNCFKKELMHKKEGRSWTWARVDAS